MKGQLARLHNPRALERWNGRSGVYELRYRWDQGTHRPAGHRGWSAGRRAGRLMLEPESRLLLLDALRPPPGYSFDRAVGTTFTLDLVALLITPVAFALFDVESDDGRIAANPIAVLESVRRFADRITVFTQAGQIKVPPAFRAAYAYLERSVVPVKAPRPGGIFHPKVWVIRFAAPDGDVRLRFLCLSRNLTFDRSWDTVLRLDGRPTGSGQRAVAADRRLRARAPGHGDRPGPGRPPHAGRTSSPRRSRRRSGTACPMGCAWSACGRSATTASRRGRSRRTAGVDWRWHRSWSKGFLERFVKTGRRDILVSRPETLNALGAPGLAGIGRSFVLRDDAFGEADPPDAVEVDGANGDEAAAAAADAPLATTELRGLHAKLFVVDQPYWSHIYTGSANATDAAFECERRVPRRAQGTEH